MGRPTKRGLDYFPLDVDLDIKLKLIKAEFGIQGFGIVIRLFQNIYGENGYYMEWSQDVALMFADEEKVGGNVVSEVIDACLKRGIFSQEKYDQFSILTSEDIQSKYLEATSRRIDIKLKNEYVVLNEPKKQGKNINVDKNGVNANRNSVNDNRKCINKSKVNKSKLNTTTTIDGYKYTSKQQSSKSAADVVVIDDKKQMSNWIDKFENAFARPMTSYELEKLFEARKEFNDEMIMFALEIAISNNSIRMNYIEGIFNNWRTEHIDSLDKAKMQSKRFRRNNNNYSQDKSNIRTAKRPADFEENLSNARKKSNERLDQEEVAKLKSRMNSLDGSVAKGKGQRK